MMGLKQLSVDALCSTISVLQKFLEQDQGC